MDYFKHYATASDSKSLNKIFDQFGHKGIAFWWMLLELCSEHWDGKSKPEFEFHSRTVVTKLKSSLRSVVPWLELCSDLGMCAFAKNETQLTIMIPKLMKIKTSRSVIKSNKKQLPVYLDIDLEKEEDIEKERLNHKQLIKIYNSILGDVAKYDAWFFSGEMREDFETACGFPGFQEKQTWINYFTRVSKSDFLTGKKPGSSFKASLPWLLRSKNMAKVLSSGYDNQEQIGANTDAYEALKKREQELGESA